MGIRSRLALCALVVGTALAACTPPTTGPVDVAGPTIVSVTASPATVTPGASLTLSAHLTDVSAVGLVTIQGSLDGQLLNLCKVQGARISGTAYDGTWSLTCPVPAVVNSGVYRVDVVALDMKGNAVNTNGLPDDQAWAEFTVTGGLSDVDPPALVSVTGTPDPATRGQLLTLSAHLTDATGVSNVAITVSQGGNVLSLCTTQGTRTSGTVTDGTWTLACNLPFAAVPGLARIDVVALDQLGNALNTNGGPASPVPGSFTVAA